MLYMYINLGILSGTELSYTFTALSVNYGTVLSKYKRCRTVLAFLFNKSIFLLVWCLYKTSEIDNHIIANLTNLLGL
jgi:hypothetical protein